MYLVAMASDSKIHEAQLRVHTYILCTENTYLSEVCSIVDFKYIIQQLGTNELQAMAFYTQMIHSGVSRIFELLRYNGTY